MFEIEKYACFSFSVMFLYRCVVDLYLYLLVLHNCGSKVETKSSVDMLAKDTSNTGDIQRRHTIVCGKVTIEEINERRRLKKCFKMAKTASRTNCVAEER